MDERSVEEIFGEIGEVEAANRSDRDRAKERQLVLLRHRAGAKLVADANGRPEQPQPDYDQLPEVPSGSLPEVTPDELTPELLRAGMLRDGCLLVRGVVPEQDAERMAEDIDRAFEERAALWDGGSVADPNYEEFGPEPPYQPLEERTWIRDGGGVLAADSPRTMFDLMDLFERAGLRSVVTGYLGERAAMSVNKSTLRRARPTDGGAWHQDGAFMGDVRALNVWLSLSHCGEDAPGLDLVPRRLDGIVPDRDRRGGLRLVGLAGGGRGDRGRGRDGAAAVRAWRRAPVRRALPALDVPRPQHDSDALRGRELVLRAIGVSRGLRAACLLSG